MTVFSVTEPAEIIGYALPTQQVEYASAFGTPGVSRVSIPDTYSLAGSTVAVTAFTAPVVEYPSKDTIAIEATRALSNKYVVTAIPGPCGVNGDENCTSCTI